MARRKADCPYMVWDSSGSKSSELTFRPCRPTLWIVQLGRKRASFMNEKAARTFAGSRGKVRAYVEVQA